MSGIINSVGSRSGVIGTTEPRVAFAWLRFDQSGTDAIISDYNFSSVAGVGTGVTTCHFDVNPPSTNYGVTLGGTHDAGGSISLTTISAGSFQITCCDKDGSVSNNNAITCSVWHE